RDYGVGSPTRGGLCASPLPSGATVSGPPEVRSDSVMTLYEGWSRLTSGFGATVFLACLCLLAGRFYEIAFIASPAALVVFELRMFSEKRRQSSRSASRALILWLVGALLGSCVVWYLLFMPDF